MPSELRRQKDEERKRLSREHLLNAAVRVFSSRGYHKALISDIVLEAGVGQGTFYRYFDGKYEIFDTLLDRLIENLFSYFSEMTAHLPTNEAEYRQASLDAVTRFSEAIETNKELVSLFMTEASIIDKKMEKKVASIYENFARLARFYLDHAVASGFARPCNTAIVSQSLVGIAIRMIGLWWKDGINGSTRDELIKEIVDFAFIGFGLSGTQQP
jgi:AcrR family transcriptional regulator